jgi:hypothetical protein
MMRQNRRTGNYLERGAMELAICMTVVAGASPNTVTT